MAETIFTGKEVEKLFDIEVFAFVAAAPAKIPGFAENLFMCDRPADAGDR